MSELIVEVCRVDKVKAHPNAQKLSIVEIKGWQCCTQLDAYVPGQLVTYIPPDSILPAELASRIGVEKYLHNGRVRCTKLRGEPSFGIVINETLGAEGENVADKYGITKWIPPLKTSTGQVIPDHPMFPKYTSIENMRNYPTILQDGEQVIATEKVHGTNVRAGLANGEQLAGSHRLVRRRPIDSEIAINLYWHPWSLPGVQALMAAYKDTPQAILYGEVYGKVQSLRYGIPNGIAFRAFDFLVNGQYLDYDEFEYVCHAYDIPTVPLIYRGPFSLDKIKEISGGQSTLPNANHIREGVVVRPVSERHNPRTGRVILKYVSDAYLLGDESDSQEV